VVIIKKEKRKKIYGIPLCEQTFALGVFKKEKGGGKAKKSYSTK
jgi:hypothetical protein